MRSWTIRKRVALSFGAVVAVLCGAAIFSYWDLTGVIHEAEYSAQVNATDQIAAGRQIDHLKWVQDLSRHLLSGAEFRGQLDPTKCRFGQWLGDRVEQEKITDPELKKLIAEIDSPHRELHSSAERILALQKAGDEAGARSVFEKTTLKTLSEVESRLSAISQRSQATASEVTAKMLADTRRGRLLQVGLCLLGVAVALTLGFLLVRHLNSTLNLAIGNLMDGSEQVSSAAGQVAVSSQSLAQGASEQAALLEETSASAQEISSMAHTNSEKSRKAATLMAESQQGFAATNKSLDEMVTAMNEINSQSDRVSKIIKVIQDIAFQTNILALNAAVEAARAGEAGMGFAVVADEVRNLAQRSAQAARDTSALIEESITKSNAGKAKVDRLATLIRTLTEEAASVKTLVEEVNSGSQEQTRGIEQMSKATVQMEGVTQTAAASAEEGASAAEQLAAQSETLKDIVRRLTVMVNGSDGVRSA